MFSHPLPWLVGLLVAITEMSTDLFVPGLPTISQFFHTSEAVTGLTISLNLLGLAFSGLIYGPLSDHFGRRKVMRVGLSLFAFASVLCSLSTTIEQLIAFRLLQGLGGGVTIVVGLSSIRDRYHSATCAQMISIIEMIIALSPGLAPVVGSFIIASASWHSVFWTVAVISALALLLTWRVYPETNQTPRTYPFTWRATFKSYARLFSMKKFLGYSYIQVLCTAWMVSEYAILPFVYVNTLHVSLHHFGLFMMAHFGAYFLGTLINQTLVHYFGVSRTLFLGLLIYTSAALALFGYEHFCTPNALHTTLLLAGTAFGAAFTIGNAMTKALGYVGHEAGAGTAFITCWQLTLGSVFVLVLGYFYNGTLAPLGMLLSGCGGTSLLMYFYVKRHVPSRQRPLIS